MYHQLRHNEYIIVEQKATTLRFITSITQEEIPFYMILRMLLLNLLIVTADRQYVDFVSSIENNLLQDPPARHLVSESFRLVQVK